MNQPQKDLINYIDAIPYGDISLKVQKRDRRVTKITTTGEETLRYVENEEAQKDLDNMVKQLIESGYSGDANVKLSMKDGKIWQISIFNKKETNY